MTETNQADELTVRDVIARYNRYLDDRRFDALVDLFEPDGVLHAMGATTSGHAELRATFAKAGEPLDRPTTTHHTTNVIVDVDGDTATAESDFVVIRRTAAGLELTMAGRYRDRLTKANDAWRFAERRAIALAKSA